VSTGWGAALGATKTQVPRAHAPLLLSRYEWFCAPPGRHPPTPHFAGGKTETAKGKVLPKVTQQGGQGKNWASVHILLIAFQTHPVHSACDWPPFWSNCLAWVSVAVVCASGSAVPCQDLSRVCLQMARVSLQPRVCLKVGVCVVPLEKREEVVRLAPEVCAGPVVSRPGRWELSSGINCLFASSWEVASLPRRPVAPSQARPQISLPSEVASGYGPGRQVSPKPQVELGWCGSRAPRDASAPCRPLRSQGSGTQRHPAPSVRRGDALPEDQRGPNQRDPGGDPGPRPPTHSIPSHLLEPVKAILPFRLIYHLLYLDSTCTRSPRK
jgi:hypothetical protein